VCKSHVVRNTRDWYAAIRPELSRDADGSLAQIGISPDQAVADCDELLPLIQQRQTTPTTEAQLAEIHSRYAAARTPKKLGGDKETACACLLWIAGAYGNG
jgi:hypothetical protein